ncbi:MAG: hypothetical protein IKX59_10630 [Bacteroidales bacterium]|nr:hypothetical protein [Bacteroidales bacterium]
MKTKKIKRYILFFFIVAFHNLAIAQEQDLNEILDIAYVDFCQHLDPSNKLFFPKNLTFFNSNSFAIEENHQTKNLIRKKQYHSLRSFPWKKWPHNFKQDTYFIDTPTIILKRDSIIVMNHSAGVGAEGGFRYGYSYISLFVFNKEKNKWIFEKGWKPELEFRKSTLFDSLLEQCRNKAINYIQTQSKKDDVMIYQVSDYYPPNYFAENQPNILLVPYGIDCSDFKKKADYYIAYPQVTFRGKRMTISMRVIESSKYNANQELSDFQIVSEEYDLDSYLQ